MRTIKQIDEEVAAIRETLARLDADKAKALAELEKAKAVRERHALDARSDAAANKKLTAARDQQRAAELVVEDCQLAAAEAARRIDALQTEREALFRDAKWLEFVEKSKVAIEEAEAFDKVFTALASTLAKHVGTLRSLTNLSTAAGRQKQFELKHFRRFLDSRLHRVLPFEYAKGAAEYRDEGYGAFVRAWVGGADAEDSNAEPQQNINVQQSA